MQTLATFGGTDHAARGLDLLVMCGLSRTVFLSCGKRECLHHHVQGSTTVDNVHPVLRQYDRFWFGCVRVFDRSVAFEERRFVHVCESTFYLVENLVEFPRFPDLLDTLQVGMLHFV